MPGKIEQTRRIVNQIRPLLADHPPAIQGAVLLELLATFIAGQHPLLRDEILTLHVKAVRELVPECEAELFATRERPPDWHHSPSKPTR